VPTYNRPQVLKKTLGYLERQATTIPFEVIVVDDYSTSLLPDLGFGKGKRANWKLLRNDKNLGRAATRNKGIRAAKGKYILMIDDDIRAAPMLIEVHYNAQTKIGGGVVVGSMPIASDVIHDMWNDYYRKWIKNIHETMAKYKSDLPYNFFFTGNVSAPKSLLETVGLFDESFTRYSGEDTELGYRLKKGGALFIHEPLAFGEHYNVETLDSLILKSKNMGYSAFDLVKIHPELSTEFSVAGLLAPGKAYYRLFLSRNFLSPCVFLCRMMAAVQLNTLCIFFLTKLCKAYSGLGLKEAINVSQ